MQERLSRVTDNLNITHRWKLVKPIGGGRAFEVSPSFTRGTADVNARAGNLQTGSRLLLCQEKERRGQSFTSLLSRNCATVMHFGCSISILKKFLSPMRITSTSDTMAAFKIGWSFVSRISFSAWSTAGINS